MFQGLLLMTVKQEVHSNPSSCLSHLIVIGCCLHQLLICDLMTQVTDDWMRPSLCVSLSRRFIQDTSCLGSFPSPAIAKVCDNREGLRAIMSPAYHLETGQSVGHGCV